jgi:hypothetical protein
VSTFYTILGHPLRLTFIEPGYSTHPVLPCFIRLGHPLLRER